MRKTTPTTRGAKALTSVALVGSLLGLAACGSGDTEAGDGDSQGPTTATTQQPSGGASGAPGQDGQAPSMPEPDVGNVPEVVATVNGEEITGEEFTAAYEAQFQQMAMQSQMTGAEPNQDEMKQQLADSMVGSELLVQDAENNGHSSSDEDVDAFLEETATASGLGSVDELMATFEEQGYPEDQVRSDAQKQLALDATIEELDVPEPTDEELKTLYDQALAAQPPAEGGGASASVEEGPSFDELKPQLEQQVQAQKQNEAVAQKVEELRQDADVDVRL